MFLRLIRGTLVLATTAVAIPYALAILTNILNGWPQSKNKYKRALHPKKVLGLNYVILQMLRDKGRFLFLYMKWKSFYRNADPRRVLKNLTFGRNDCTMDVYLPPPLVREPHQTVPVVIFVYGGAWSTGDKGMYGMLCEQIVASTGSIVVCPNYSLYPKGYVDDMIQDVVDCIGWVVECVEDYGGDKDKIVLIGHSAGAHLCTMAILELLHDEKISGPPEFRFQQTEELEASMEGLSFADSHYGRMRSKDSKEIRDDSSGSSESFAVVSDNGAALEQSLDGSTGGYSMLSGSQGSEMLDASHNAEAFNSSMSGSTVMVEAGNSNVESGSNEIKPDSDSLETEEGKVAEPEVCPDSEGAKLPEHSGEAVHTSGSVGDDEEDNDEDSGDNDSVLTVLPKDIDRTTLVDMCRAVKAFIGLAGVYSIGDHFLHEASRGIEDVSRMCRAHYGEDHFERFSPTQILTCLGKELSLPQMVLVHGTKDYIVPVESTHKFASALSNIHANVKARIIPDCDHYEICLDLMESDRKYYSHVMGIIMETVGGVATR